MQNKLHHWWLGSLLVLIGASSYGILAVFIKAAYGEGWSSAQITTAQVTGGAVLLWLTALTRFKYWTNPFRGQWYKLSLIGICSLSMTTVLLNESLSYLNASLSIVLLFQFAWITLVVELMIARRKPTSREVIAVLFVLTGTVLSVGGIQIDTLREINTIGLIFGFLSAFSYSAFILFAGRVGNNLEPTLKSAFMYTSALPIVWIIYWPFAWITEVESSLIGWGVLLGLLGAAIPTILFNIGIPKIGSPAAAIIGSAELPVAMIGAFFILQEAISWMQWVGMALIITSIVISQQKQK